jgi:hypothetical protein
MRVSVNTLLLLPVVFFLLLIVPVQAGAQTTDWTESGCVEDGVATLRCIPVVMQNVINFLIVFAAVICVFMIIFAGYKFVTSEGDPEKISTARKAALYGIGGFILVLLSFFLMNVIGTFTGVSQLKPTP